MYIYFVTRSQLEVLGIILQVRDYMIYYFPYYCLVNRIVCWYCIIFTWTCWHLPWKGCKKCVSIWAWLRSFVNMFCLASLGCVWL